MADKQTDGRKANGAEPEGKPDPATSSKAVKGVGKHEATTAEPDASFAGW